MKTINKYKSPAYAVDVWSNHLKSFGLGEFMGCDLPIGKRGKIPTSKTYNSLYPNWHWDSKTIVSNAIGQGEVLMTPIQLANFMATVANRGYYYTPHIVKKIKGDLIDKKFRTKHVTTIHKKYFEPVINGMNAVYGPGGTASGLGVDGIEICGKTGTAENYLRVNGKRVKLQDHSIFVAFAPKENPKIAIAVFVENGYWGKRWAGPITTLMIEKYLNGKITKVDFEKRMLEGSLQDQYRKLYPQKHQDSLSVINNKVKDSILKLKNSDDINADKKVKKDSIN
jgi:penicillin-binding protein 2